MGQGRGRARNKGVRAARHFAGVQDAFDRSQKLICQSARWNYPTQSVEARMVFSAASSVFLISAGCPVLDRRGWARNLQSDSKRPSTTPLPIGKAPWAVADWILHPRSHAFEITSASQRLAKEFPVQTFRFGHAFFQRDIQQGSSPLSARGSAQSAIPTAEYRHRFNTPGFEGVGCRDSSSVQPTMTGISDAPFPATESADNASSRKDRQYLSVQFGSHRRTFWGAVGKSVKVPLANSAGLVDCAGTVRS
jgi:hypothetical protein